MTVSKNTLSETEIILKLGKDGFKTVAVALLCTFLVWYVQYHWKRRNLYRMAAQRKGPLTLPLIGNALYFVGSTSDILNAALRLAIDFASPVPVWLGQRLYFSVWTPIDLEIILNSPHALGKDKVYKYAEIAMGAGLFTASVSKWKRHRKIIMPTFNQKILDEFVEVFSKQLTILLEQMKKEVGKGTFNIFDYVSRCTLDIVCETAMGIPVNAQTTGSNYLRWTSQALEIAYERMFKIWYQCDFIFNQTSLAKQQHDVAQKIRAFTGSVVTEKRKAYQKKLKDSKEKTEALFDEELQNRNSFLQQLIELSEEGAKFTDEELRGEVETFMVAGSDTTAAMSSFTFVMLGMFPGIQDRVYEEVVDVMGPDRPMERKDLGKLLYLEMVIKETLRLFPVGATLARTVTKDIKLEKCTIPAGCSVVMPIIVLHRDPELWPDPLNFDPNRFLPEEVAKRHPYSWLPFSAGPRNCPGIKYAMMIMKVLVATVVRKYRLSTDYKRPEDIKLKSEVMTKPVDGYRISVELRK